MNDPRNDLNAEFVRLFSRLFHDLRSPVNAIIGFSNLVRDGTVGPINAKQQELLDDVLVSAKQLVAIIDSDDRRAKALITAFGAVVDDLNT